MRVALAATAIDGPASGAGRRLLCLAPALADRGIEVVFFVSDRLRDAPLASRANLEVVPLPVPPRPTAARAAAERVFLPRAARDRRVDLVDVDHWPIPPIRSCPVVVTIHDLRVFARATPVALARRLLAPRVYASGLARAAAVVAVSEFTAREAGIHLGVPRERIAVVPNAGDHLAAPTRRPSPGRFLLHVGHLEPRKDLPTLLRALAILEGLGRRADLVLAGREGMHGARARLAGEAARLGVGDRVLFAGSVPDAALPDLYSASIAAVFPSLYEGFGIGLLEAMRCGAPVLASRAGAHPEVAGDAAAWFDPGQSSSLADEAERLFADAPRREALVAAGARRAALYSWSRSAGLLASVYRGVSAPSG